MNTEAKTIAINTRMSDIFSCSIISGAILNLNTVKIVVKNAKEKIMIPLKKKSIIRFVKTKHMTTANIKIKSIKFFILKHHPTYFL